ncbi:MAG: universal stress protein [Gammaproteobacteria bacterium]|nr:universal stress protein [Gammaproteobacteria bacterium]
MRNFNRILAPTDFSSYSDEGLCLAADLAEKFGSEIVVLHVLTSEELKEKKSMPLPAGYLDTIFRETEQQAREHFEKVLGSGKQDLQVRAVVASGDPFAEIIRKAREEQIDMIVLATHGRTGLSHVLVGSVAEKVVRMADCPVLTVRPGEHRFEMP